MATNSVEYLSCNRLCCGDLPAPIFLCIPTEIVEPHLCPSSYGYSGSGGGDDPMPFDFSFIEAEIGTETEIKGRCNTTTWRYIFTYDDSQLVSGAILSGTDINGIFCQGCFTDWIQQLVGQEPYIRTEDSGQQTFVSPHGCEYPLEAAGADDAWLLQGNAGTIDGLNFIGTLDDVPFSARVNDIRAFKLNPGNPLGNDAPDIIVGHPENDIVGDAIGSGNGILSGGESGTPNIIGDGTAVYYSVIGGGIGNQIIGAGLPVGCVIGGGVLNLIDEGAATAFIGGGSDNIINGNGISDVICGGIFNSIITLLEEEGKNFIGGGNLNTIENAEHCYIGGGWQNTITGIGPVASAILGGRQNVLGTTATYSSILGGGALELGRTSVGFHSNLGSTPSAANRANLSAFTDIAYFGNTDLWIGNTDSTARKLKLFEPNSALNFSGTNYSSFQAQAQGANIEYVLPATAGTPGQQLTIAGVVGNVVTLSWT